MDTSTCPRRGSAPACTERLGELEGRKREEERARARGRATETAECDLDERESAICREKHRRARRHAAALHRALHRTAPAGEPVAAVTAVNRAGALNPRRPRRSRRPLHRLPPRDPSKRPDRFAKLSPRPDYISTRKRWIRRTETFLFLFPLSSQPPLISSSLSLIRRESSRPSQRER